MASRRDKLETTGIVAGLVLGLWGAVLSTYQVLTSHWESQPQMFAQLQISRSPDGKGDTAAVEVALSNVGKSEVPMASEISVLAFNPGSGHTSQVGARFDQTRAFGLPAVIAPGTNAVALGTTNEPKHFLGVNYRYRVVAQTTEGEVYVSNFIAAPITDPAAYDAMTEAAKYQTKIEFGSVPLRKVAL